MFMSILLTIVKRMKQPRSPSTDERLHKMWYIHITGYYSALKRENILIHATMWMKSEDAMLNEISQIEKEYWMMPLI